MKRRCLPVSKSHPRQGSLLPAVTVAFLVCGSCLALVLNQYWLAGAQEELRTATLSVALATVQELANDDLLKPDADPLQISQRAREVGLAQAEKNPVAGRWSSQMDIRLGRVVFDPLTGQQQTLETDYSPNAAIVTGHRDRSRSNPVALLVPAFTGRPQANVAVRVEASLSNLVLGVRAIGAADVPAWPLAILEFTPDPRVQCWKTQIEARRGSDELSWDAASQTVVDGPDGLPEILLLPKGPKGTNNLFLANIGNELQDEALERQFREGWSATDLATFGEIFSLKPGPLTVSASDDFSGIPHEGLASQIGQTRIALLYNMQTTNGKDGTEVQLTRLVAVRLLRVEQGEDGPEYTVQPTVVATRTAVLDEDALYAGETLGNPYLYKISITH